MSCGFDSRPRHQSFSSRAGPGNPFKCTGAKMSLDTSFLYRLTNNFQGPGQALDVKADRSGRLKMAATADLHTHLHYVARRRTSCLACGDALMPRNSPGSILSGPPVRCHLSSLSQLRTAWPSSCHPELSSPAHRAQRRNRLPTAAPCR